MTRESDPAAALPDGGTALPFAAAYGRLHESGWRGIGIAVGNEVVLSCGAEDTKPLTAAQSERLIQGTSAGQITVSSGESPNRSGRMRQEVHYEGADTRELASVMNFLITHGDSQSSQ